MRRLPMLISLCCVSILFAACGSNANNILTVSDTSPSNIDLKVSLSLNNSGRGKNYLEIITQQGQTWVAMSHGETMVCNGIPLALDSDKIGFVAQDFPLDTPTTPVTCMYTSGTHEASFTFTPPPPPQVLNPKAGAILDHSQPLTVSYSAKNGFRIRASAEVQNGEKLAGGTYIDAADNGGIALDMHNLHAGQGSIQITRFTDNYLDGTGFHSFEISCDTTTILNVTWV